MGLVGRLAADPQGVADLAPGVAFHARGVGPQISDMSQALSGVSDGAEGRKGVLVASAGALQPGDGAADGASGVAALLGAHVKWDYHQVPTIPGKHRQSELRRSICDTPFRNTPGRRASDAHGAAGSWLGAKKRPGSAATLRGLATTESTQR